MPEGPDGKTIIVVKKVSGHGGHHGGAWKVAYADFVTAMMCLFLVLWLVNSASEPTRQRIASYFRKPGIFDKGSGTPLEIGGGGLLPDSFSPPGEANSQITASKKIYEIDARTGKVRDYFDPALGEKEGAGPEEGKAERMPEGGREQPDAKKIDPAKLKAELEEAVSGQVEGSAKEPNRLGQVDIKVDQRGLLVEIMDTEKASMFQVGSSEIQEDAVKQLSRIAHILAALPNPLDIEGHTDARPYRNVLNGAYDNWDLSVDRANAARRVLQQAGISNNKIARVVGYASQRPKLPEDPLDASNRRITIAMRFTEQAKGALDGTKTVETRPRPLGAPASREAKPQADASAAPEVLSEETAPPVEPSAAQLPTETPASERKSGALDVEVKTTLPEGATLASETEPEEDEEAIPAKKEKIFGENNPFLVQ